MFKLQSDEKRQLIFTASILTAIGLTILTSFFIAKKHQGPISEHRYEIEVSYTNGELDTLNIKYNGREIDSLILDEECIQTSFTDNTKVCGVRNFKIIDYVFY